MVQTKRLTGFGLIGELLLTTVIIAGLLWAVQAQQTALPIASAWADARIAAGEAPAKDRHKLIAAYQAAYTWQDAEGRRSTYPISRDSFYFLRLARNIVQFGTPCPTSLTTKRCRDTQVDPPDGRPMIDARSPQPWSIALVYKTLQAIGAKPSMLYAGRLQNRLILIVCGLMTYLLARRLSPATPRISGITAAVSLVLLPIVIERCFGVDDDVWVMALLLGGTLATADFVSAAPSRDWRWFSLIAALLTPVLLSATWGGWPFLVILEGSLAVVALAVTSGQSRMQHYRRVSPYKAIFILGTASIFLGVLTYHWMSDVHIARHVMTGKLPPPDAFAAVAELTPVDLVRVAGAYTWPILIAGVTGLVIALHRLWRWEHTDFPATLLLILAWCAGAMILLIAIRYERLLIIAAPCLAILAGLAVGALPARLPGHTLRRIATPGLGLLLMASVTANAITLVRHNRPQLNTAWVAVLNYLSRNTPANAILVGWWNEGHWITYWSRRTTAVDGASLRNPRMHAVGRLLTTADDSRKTLDTLADMAACGKHAACGRPVYLLTSDALLHEFGWMFSGFWQGKRAALVDDVAAGKVPTGVPKHLLAAARTISTPLERSLFAAPQARIWSTHWSPCHVAKDNTYDCPMHIVSKNGWLVEGLIIPQGHIKDTRLLVRGRAGIAPLKVQLSMIRLATQDRLFDVRLGGSSKNPGILLDLVKRRAFLGTPAMLDSLVARLVLLNGRYDYDHFRRVISARTVDGHRVTAWRVLQ